jgi:hypothetical protein
VDGIEILLCLSRFKIVTAKNIFYSSSSPVSPYLQATIVKYISLSGEELQDWKADPEVAVSQNLRLLLRAII